MAANEVKQLEEAQLAKHKLVTGTRVVKINKGGMSVEYTSANLYELNAYIAELELKVNGSQRRRAPVGFRF